MQNEFDQSCQDCPNHADVEQPIGRAFIMGDQQPDTNAEYDGVRHSINDEVRDLCVSINFH